MTIAAGTVSGPTFATLTAMMFDVTRVATKSAATASRRGLGARVGVAGRMPPKGSGRVGS